MGDDFLGDPAEGDKDFAPVVEGEGGGNAGLGFVEVNCDDPANGQEARGGFDDLPGFYKQDSEGFTEDFSDPEFMKRQQEELERLAEQHRLN